MLVFLVLLLVGTSATGVSTGYTLVTTFQTWVSSSQGSHGDWDLAVVLSLLSIQQVEGRWGGYQFGTEFEVNRSYERGCQ